MSAEPLLFRMRWRGYDPAEVTECYLIMTQSFETYARTVEAEKEALSQEILKWMDRVEEEKECRMKLQKLLESERQENTKLRARLALSAAADGFVSGAAGPGAPGLPGGLPGKGCGESSSTS